MVSDPFQGVARTSLDEGVIKISYDPPDTQVLRITRELFEELVKQANPRRRVIIES